MVDFPPPPETPAPPFGRTRHPFFMHEMIRRQSVAVQATLGILPEAAALIPGPAAHGRLLFTGIGTSFHAALGASNMAVQWAGDRFRSEARQAFDLVDDPMLLDGLSMAVVYSSSG
ncbi:MAG: hypothetical protein L3J91_06110, partial [Thermoplasmata archaeon]|nr:hypothetical protein [Thermoplasmata archaeon]